MRNPNRIDNVLNEIKRIWKKNPNLRLLQLLLNIDCEHYYIEDEQLVEKLRNFYEKEEKPKENNSELPNWGWYD
jgi:uncharacterized protein YihD (DUF1040 family)